MQKLWQAIGNNIFDVMKTTTIDIINEGFPMSAILMQLHDDVISHSTLTDVDKALICEKIALVCSFFRIIIYNVSLRI